MAQNKSSSSLQFPFSELVSPSFNFSNNTSPGLGFSYSPIASDAFSLSPVVNSGQTPLNDHCPEYHADPQLSAMPELAKGSSRGFDLNQMNYDFHHPNGIDNSFGSRMLAYRNYPSVDFNCDIFGSQTGTTNILETQLFFQHQQYQYGDPTNLQHPQPYYLQRHDSEYVDPFSNINDSAAQQSDGSSYARRPSSFGQNNGTAPFGVDWNSPSGTNSTDTFHPKIESKSDRVGDPPILRVQKGLENRTKGRSEENDNRHTLYHAEKPKKDDDHDWVRTNSTTLGKSTRTGKINAYDPRRDGKYRDTEHPIGTWYSQSGTKFEYTDHGELRQMTFTPKQLREFLYEHQEQKNSKLVIWIQKTPADSGRRYPTRGSNKCRFKDCPASTFSRSIGVGLFRVALDEQWEKFGDERDPFHVAGYVHLYCLERFCDFADICHRLDVRADSRELVSEPKGTFLPSLGYTQLYKIADDFIQSCKEGLLHFQYPAYPDHAKTSPGAPKQHEGTLTYALTVAKNSATNNAKLLMLEGRGLKRSNILVHKGDLEMAVNARKETTSSIMCGGRVSGVKTTRFDEEGESDTDYGNWRSSGHRATITCNRRHARSLRHHAFESVPRNAWGETTRIRKSTPRLAAMTAQSKVAAMCLGGMNDRDTRTANVPNVQRSQIGTNRALPGRGSGNAALVSELYESFDKDIIMTDAKVSTANSMHQLFGPRKSKDDSPVFF